MAQFFRRVLDRARGKCHVETICDKVFAELAEKNDNLLKPDYLHVATLLVYNSINKQLLGPHKDPPTMEAIAEKKKLYCPTNVKRINREEFRKMILEWVSKDLSLVLANKAAVALLAAPLLAVMTKNAGKQVPKIRDAVEKVPTPLLFSIFSVGLILLQDSRMGKQ